MTPPAKAAPGPNARRRLLRAATVPWALPLVAAALAGCGFRLKGPTPLPFRQIALTGFAPTSPLADELRRQLEQAGAAVLPPAQSQVVLEALVDRRERTVVASTAAGQVRELQLRVRLNFRVSTRGGLPLLSPDEIVLSRDMSFSESNVLAKMDEEAGIFRALDMDIADQVVRRLAAVRLS